MRERREPAPLAPEPPRWPGPGLRPRLGPAAARAGGCPGGRGSGFGAGRAGAAGLSLCRFGPSPPRRKGHLRAAARCDTAVAQPGGRLCPRFGAWDGAAAAATSGPPASRRQQRCSRLPGAPGGACRAVLPGSREEERCGRAGPVLALPSRASRSGAVCGGSAPARGGAGSPPAGAGTAPREEGFGVRRNSPRCGVLLSPHGLTGSTVLELLSVAKQTPRAALRSSGGAASGAGRAPIATVRAVRERDPRAANRVRANFVRRILPLGRAAREEIT